MNCFDWSDIFENARTLPADWRVGTHPMWRDLSSLQTGQSGGLATPFTLSTQPLSNIHREKVPWDNLDPIRLRYLGCIGRKSVAGHCRPLHVCRLGYSFSWKNVERMLKESVRRCRSVRGYRLVKKPPSLAGTESKLGSKALRAGSLSLTELKGVRNVFTQWICSMQFTHLRTA